MSKVTRLLQSCLDSYVAARGSAFTPEEGQALLDQLTSLAEGAIRCEKATDSYIKALKKQERARHKSARQMLKRAEKQREAQLQKVRGDPQRAGYSNSVDVLAPYSANPYWLGRGHARPSEN
jgi:hypothetical protein